MSVTKGSLTEMKRENFVLWAQRRQMQSVLTFAGGWVLQFIYLKISFSNDPLSHREANRVSKNVFKCTFQ